jgi:hypothetical protein
MPAKRFASAPESWGIEMKSSFIFAIRDGEGRWFAGLLKGEPRFVKAQPKARQYDKASKAIAIRDHLVQMRHDESLTVRVCRITNPENQP